MTAGTSTWWATPVDRFAHLSLEDLARSDRHHRPLRRMGLAGLLARIALLLVAAAAGSRIAGSGIEPLTDTYSWVSAVVSPRVVTGALLTAVALRLPSTLVDGWFECRFKHGRHGYEPVPVQWFAATGVALIVGSAGALCLAAGLGYRYAIDSERWPVAIVGLVVGIVVVSAGVERWIRRLVPGGEHPLDPDSAAATELTGLAARFGLTGIEFGSTSRPSVAGGEPVAANAYAIGLGRNRRVVLTDELLAGDRVIRDFIVAHELTHIARRHLAVQAAVAGLASIAGVPVVAALAVSGWPWSAFGLDPYDPLGLPIVAVIVLGVGAVSGPVVAWVSRAQERSADSGAIAVTGPVAADQARRLHIESSADLDPPWWVRLYSLHPPPAERLEYLARHRNS